MSNLGCPCREFGNATVYDLSETMVREHLRACEAARCWRGSVLDASGPSTGRWTSSGASTPTKCPATWHSSSLPRDPDPARWFPGAKIEVALLRAGTGGDVIEEKDFGGGLAEQVSGCLAYLRREVIGLEIRKSSDGLQASHRTNYPEDALREALVNALFHRGYDRDSPHTTLVRVTSDRIDIRSTPGPVRGIDRDQLRRGATPRLVPPRNPRIGELFKEIGLAEKRLTGLGKIYQAMERNGSPPPEFYFDEQRTFFQATLFAHPWQSAASAIRRAGELRAVGRPGAAAVALESAWRADPASLVLAPTSNSQKRAT